MQKSPPPSGKLFPDNPQPQSGPRFASNAPQQPTQAYEPQTRMQQTGSYQPVQPAYGTGHLTPLHGTTPVSQLPPMSSMPVAPAQQPSSRRKYAPQSEPDQHPPVTLQGTPLMVHTVQGMPVAVNAEEMERALSELAMKSGKRKGVRQKPDSNGKEKPGKRRRKFSLIWNVFAFIGVISVLLLILEWFGIPLLVLLNDLNVGGTP